jgi:hypothetical protein
MPSAAVVTRISDWGTIQAQLLCWDEGTSADIVTSHAAANRSQNCVVDACGAGRFWGRCTCTSLYLGIPWFRRTHHASLMRSQPAEGAGHSSTLQNERLGRSVVVECSCNQSVPHYAQHEVTRSCKQLHTRKLERLPRLACHSVPHQQLLPMPSTAAEEHGITRLYDKPTSVLWNNACCIDEARLESPSLNDS